jgi:hypothetical protein
MGMGVDQAGHDQVAAAIYNSICGAGVGEIGHGPHSRNFSGLDGYIAMTDHLRKTIYKWQYGCVYDQDVRMHKLYSPLLKNC